jgi:hypothetical protein
VPESKIVRSAPLFDRGKLSSWKLMVEKIALLLEHASDSLGEDIPYTNANAPGIDLVDAIIDGAAALVRELAGVLGDMEDRLVEEETRLKEDGKHAR